MQTNIVFLNIEFLYKGELFYFIMVLNTLIKGRNSATCNNLIVNEYINVTEAKKYHQNVLTKRTVADFQLNLRQMIIRCSLI